MFCGAFRALASSFCRFNRLPPAQALRRGADLNLLGAKNETGRPKAERAGANESSARQSAAQAPVEAFIDQHSHTVSRYSQFA